MCVCVFYKSLQFSAFLKSLWVESKSGRKQNKSPLWDHDYLEAVCAGFIYISQTWKHADITARREQLPARARPNVERNRDEKTSRASRPFLLFHCIPPDCIWGWFTQKLWYRTRCGGQMSHTVRSTPEQTRRHTHTHSWTLAYVGCFHGPFHFTWSCDMVMISILSFWVVIALSSLEHCQRGRRERTAGKPSEGGMTEKKKRENQTSEEEKIRAAHR